MRKYEERKNLNTDNWVHIEAGQLSSLYHSYTDLVSKKKVMNGNESILSKICWSSPSVIPNESLKISPDSLELLGLYLQWSSSCS